MIIKVTATTHLQNHLWIARQAIKWEDVAGVHIGKGCVIIITNPIKGLSAAVARHRLRGYLNLEVEQL